MSTKGVYWRSGIRFWKRGKLDYFMHNSYIFTVVPSLQSAFKIGSIGSEVGNQSGPGRGSPAPSQCGADRDPVCRAEVTDEDTGASRDARTDDR